MILLASRTGTVRRRWRAGLKRFTVQEAADPRRLETLVSERAPVVVIVDVGMLGARGIAEVASLQRLSPASRFIVASPQPAEREGLAVFRAGARGYCHRDLDPALLAKAVEVVQKGEIWAGRVLVARLIEELGTRARTQVRADNGARVGALTAREREIAGLVAGGASNKEIASRLGVTERTVKAHLTAIFRKLGVTDRLRLALYLNGAATFDEAGVAPKSNLRTAPARDE
ncbi:MAG: response regulator transcription factor [Candidatus Rokubacteria bacterium]|nr:response regulator transcription factor [Candidatus Rokubacteria bacterium]